MAEFAERTGIPYPALCECTKTSNRNHIREEIENRLAQACGFELDWPEWIDTEDIREKNQPDQCYKQKPRRDTCKAFKVRLEEEGKARANTGWTATEIMPSAAMKASRIGPSEQLNSRLASMWLSIDQGNLSHAHIELSCEVTEIDPNIPRILVSRGVVEADLQGAEIGSQSTTLKLLADYLAKSKRETLITFSGPRDKPSWEFQSPAAKGNRKRRPVGLHSVSPLCELHNLKSGQHIIFSFRAFSKDVIFEADGPAVKFAYQGGPGLGDEMGAASPSDIAKQKLIKLLWEQSLSGKINGSVVLCRDVMKIDEN